MGRHEEEPDPGRVVDTGGRHRAAHDGEHHAAEAAHPPPPPVTVSRTASPAQGRARVVPALWGASGSLAAAAMSLVLISGEQGLGYGLLHPPQGSGPTDPGVGGSGGGAAGAPAVGRQFSPDDGWAGSSWRADGLDALLLDGAAVRLPGRDGATGGGSASPGGGTSGATLGSSGGTVASPVAVQPASPSGTVAGAQPVDRSGPTVAAPAPAGGSTETSASPRPAGSGSSGPPDTGTGPVGQVLQPVTETVDPVVAPVGTVVEPVAEATAPVAGPVAEVVAPVAGPVTDAVAPVVAPVGQVAEALPGPADIPSTESVQSLPVGLPG
jgi:hypothetical protein